MSSPIAPSPKALNLLGISLDEDEPLHMDEFKCLNLNITAPFSERDAELPVLVFIHGYLSLYRPFCRHRPPPPPPPPPLLLGLPDG